MEILDCTIRDGSYVNNFQFTLDDVVEIVQGLDESGIKYIEVGHGLGLGASSLKYGIAAATDEEYLKTARSAVKKAYLTTMILAHIGQVKHVDLAHKYNIHMVRIAADVHDIDRAEPFIRRAKELGLKCTLNVLKTYLLDPKTLGQMAKKIKNFGTDVLYIVDSAGCMFPDEVRKMIRMVRDNVDIEIGFHGHNNLSMALTNGLVCIEEDIDYIDSSLHGMGRSAGNLQTELFIGVLKKMGLEMPYDLRRLFDISKRTIEPMMMSGQGIEELDIVFGLANMHSGSLKLMGEYSKKYEIDIRDLIFELGKRGQAVINEPLIKEVTIDILRKQSRKKIRYPKRIYLQKQKYFDEGVYYERKT